MSWLGDIIRSNIIFAYFIYGLAFFSLGLVATLQARASGDQPAISRLWLLGVFGLLHGVSEWVELAAVQRWLSGDLVSLINLGFKAASYVFLLQFGVEFLRLLRPLPGWLRFLAPALCVAWIVLILSVRVEYGVGLPDWLSIADVSMRYLLGAPGACLAGYALWLGADRWRRTEGGMATSRYFAGAALGFLVYAVVGGLGVSTAPFFPASVINKDTFEAATGIPVLVFRTLCALAVSGFLAEAFVVEVTRSQSRTVSVLQQMDQLREEFISIVAHDLRSPVAVIAGYADLLKGLPAAEHGSQVEQNAVQGIRTSAKRLERMVGDLLDASRIDARRLTLAKEWVDLPALTGTVIAANASLIAGRTVQLDAQADLPKVYADPARIEQILTNLLSNAAKYSLPDTPIKVSLSATQGEAMVAVTNQGAGIPPAERARIFSRFYRTREAASGKVPGLGLGLYISKGLVEAHGGSLWLETTGNDEGETTFRFSLPLEPASVGNRG